MSIEDIRRTYGITFKVGMPVRIRPGSGSLMDGLSGKILRARAGRLVVRGETWVGDFHPNDIELADVASQISAQAEGQS